MSQEQPETSQGGMATELLTSLASNPYFRSLSIPTLLPCFTRSLLFSAGFGLFGVGTLATAGGAHYLPADMEKRADTADTSLLFFFHWLC